MKEPLITHDGVVRNRSESIYEQFCILVLQGYANECKKHGESFDPQEHSITWADTFIDDVKRAGLNAQQATDWFGFPHRCDNWQELHCIVAIAVLYAFLKGESLMGGLSDA